MSTWRPDPPDREERPPRPVAASLDRVTTGLGTPRAEVMTSVFRHWEALVGPDVAAHATPTSLRDGVLVVTVDQPAWATQLRYLTADLQRRVCSAAGAEAVSEIRIRVAGEREPRQSRRPR